MGDIVKFIKRNQLTGSDPLPALDDDAAWEELFRSDKDKPKVKHLIERYFDNLRILNEIADKCDIYRANGKAVPDELHEQFMEVSILVSDIWCELYDIYKEGI